MTGPQTGMAAPHPPYVIRGGRVLQDGESRPRPADIRVGPDGRIAALGAGLPADGLPELDAGGRLVVPGLVDAHQHLDKALTRRLVPNPECTLDGAIAAFCVYAAGMTREDLMERAGRTIDRCLRRGTVALRTHANIAPELRCRGLEALVEVRDRSRDRITLQVVAFLTAGATRMDLGEAKLWLEQAVDLGADVIGGTPAIAEEPQAFLDLLFWAAERFGLPLDLHLDEHLDAGRQLCDAVIERTRAHGLEGRVVVGHCCVLSAMPPKDAARVIAGFRDVGIGVITLPAANLFLQGREADKLTPRGLTRVRELIEAGVPVAAGSDNIEDPFIPVGSGDLLETARWTLLAGGLRADQLGLAFDMVTEIPARLMGLGPDYGMREGARADLLIVAAEDAEDLVARGGEDRTVLVGGRQVAGRG